MDMKHLIVKSEDWASVNKLILYAFVKGIYTIAPVLGECVESDHLTYISPKDICMSHRPYHGIPLQKDIFDNEALCLCQFKDDYLWYLSRVEDYGITWWIEKADAEEAIKKYQSALTEAELVE